MLYNEIFPKYESFMFVILSCHPERRRRAKDEQSLIKWTLSYPSTPLRMTSDYFAKVS
jgi:phosphoketolase